MTINLRNFTNVKFTSLWLDQTQIQRKHYPSLQTEIETETVIVGGGITGLATAYFLEQKKRDYILVEKDFIGSGSTGNNAGILSVRSIPYPTDVLQERGETETVAYYQNRLASSKLFQKIIDQYKIDCDYQRCGIIGAIDPNLQYSTKIKHNVEFLNQLGFETAFYSTNKYKIQIDPRYKDFSYYGDTSSLHSGKFIIGLAQSLKGPIFEKTAVTSVEMISKSHSEPLYSIKTPHGTVKAKHIIFAINYGLDAIKFPSFIQKNFSEYFTRLKPQLFSTFCLATRPLTKKELKSYASPPYPAFYTAEKDFYYGKITHDNRFVFGGYDIPEKTVAKNFFSSKHKNILPQLYNALLQHFPQMTFLQPKDIEYFWGGYEVASLDGLSVKLKLAPGLHFAGLYNGIGMVSGLMQAQKFAEEVEQTL